MAEVVPGNKNQVDHSDGHKSDTFDVRHPSTICFKRKTGFMPHLCNPKNRTAKTSL